MDNLVKGYSERTIRALTDCAAGRRDVVIADDSKSQCSIYELERAGREMGLEVVSCVLTSDNGKQASHRIFGRDLHHACHALDLINQRRGGYIGRFELQIKLGKMLGYSLADAAEFGASKIGQTCPCDCCGGGQ
jgi:hypothetical protein